MAACAAPFVLHTPSACAPSKHDEISRFKLEAERCAQVKDATAWCIENGKKAYAGSHRTDDDTMELIWPLVTEGSLKRRLSGAVNSDHPFAAHSVLTPQEETDLVATLKELNTHGQGIDREHLGKMVLDSLLLRPVLNEGRAFVAHSHNAKQILQAGQVGQNLFTRFFADYPDLAEKRPASVEILRAKWMTRISLRVPL